MKLFSFYIVAFSWLDEYNTDLFMLSKRKELLVFCLELTNETQYLFIPAKNCLIRRNNMPLTKHFSEFCST